MKDLDIGSLYTRLIDDNILLFMLFIVFIVSTTVYINASYKLENAEDKDRKCYVYLLFTIPLTIVLIDTMYVSLDNVATANVTTILLVGFLTNLIITNMKSRGLMYHCWDENDFLPTLIVISVLVLAINLMLTMEPSLVPLTP